VTFTEDAAITERYPASVSSPGPHKLPVNYRSLHGTITQCLGVAHPRRRAVKRSCKIDWSITTQASSAV